MKFSYWKTTHISKQYFESYERCIERIKPFLRLFKLCGMFANEIASDRVKRCSWPFYGICIFWVSVYISHACFLLYHFMKIESIKMRLMVDFVKHLVGYTNLSVNVITIYSSQNYFIKFFDRLESYDNEVRRMKNSRIDNLRVLWFATFLMTVLNLSLLSVIVVEKSEGIIFFVTFSDICMTIMHIFGTLEKSFLLYLILERFKHLNKKIVPSVLWNEKRPNMIRITDVKTLHSMLYDAQNAFNDIYSNLLLIWFASLMIHVIANIRIFREKELLIACAFVCSPILQVLTLCTICHYTAEEVHYYTEYYTKANKIACILNTDMCTLVFTGSEQAMIKIGVYTYFLNNRVSFNAAGFFTINLSLFQSIVAAVTTYFIILI